MASLSFLTYDLSVQNLRSGETFWLEGLNDRERKILFLLF
ncbi:hypothetical protein GGP87_003235 [Salinibacter ruber]|nr:hypothetical protein [Salinibacter ruber]